MSKSLKRRKRSSRNDLIITAMEKTNESCINFKTLRTSYKNFCDDGRAYNDDDNVFTAHFNANQENLAIHPKLQKRQSFYDSLSEWNNGAHIIERHVLGSFNPSYCNRHWLLIQYQFVQFKMLIYFEKTIIQF